MPLYKPKNKTINFAKKFGKTTTVSLGTYSAIKRILFVILTVLLAFPLYRFIKRQISKNITNNLENATNEQLKQIEENKERQLAENTHPLTLQQKLDKITPRRDIQTRARELAHHLGTKYSDKGNWYDIFDPRGWTENDKDVADILIKYKAQFQYLEMCYFQLTNSRSLRNDVIKLVDSDQLLRIRKALTL